MIELQKRLLTSLLLLIIIFFSLNNLPALFLFLFSLNFFSLIEFNNLFKNIYKKKNNYILSVFLLA